MTILSALFIPGLTWAGDAREKVPALYGGVVFAGLSEHLKSTYHYTYEADQDRQRADRSPLDRAFAEMFEADGSMMEDVDLDFRLGSDGAPKIVLAVAITGENVSTEQVADIHKLVIDLSCQVLYLDFGEMLILASYPVYLQYISAFPEPPEEAAIADIVRAKLFEQDPSLLSLVRDRMKSFRLRSSRLSTLRVTGMKIEDAALAQLSAQQRAGLDAYLNNLGQRYGDTLASRLGVAMLPHTKDAANAKMALRFADGRSLMFDIPAPTFAVSFTLRDFKKVVYKETSAEKAWIYGCYATVKIFEPEYNVVFFEEKMKHGEMKIVPVSQRTVDDFAAFDEALSVLMVKSTDIIKDNKKAQEEVIRKCSTM